MKITQSMISEAVQRLAKEFQPLKIFLFGSYAWGVPNENSDLDLMIVVARSDQRPVQRAQRAMHCLRGLVFPKDLLVRTQEEVDRMSKVYVSLEALVLDKGKIVYG